MIFEQKDVEVPKDWSMTATNIVACKYLHGKIGTPERETGVRQLVARVAETIRDWGMADGYFRTARRRRHFPRRARRTSWSASTPPSTRPSGSTWDAIASSPTPTRATGTGTRTTQQVEFGVTGYTSPQCSACFINSVKDSLDSILTLAKTEGMLFKWGSGTGTNLSPLRSSTESLSWRRHRQRPAQLHEGLRRLRRRHQVRRQDPPRCQDGHPQHRPSRHRRLHRVQAKEEAKAHALVAGDTTAPLPTPTPTAPSSSRTPTTPSA